jgi:transcriptional regulator with XRE-family HTH domain
MSIGEKVKEFRLSNGLKISAFAASLGIDRGQYSRIEKGELNFTVQHLRELTSQYGISIDWLLDEGGEEKQEGTMGNIKKTREEFEMPDGPLPPGFAQIFETMQHLAYENGKLEERVEHRTAERDWNENKVDQLVVENDRLKKEVEQLTSHVTRLAAENRQLNEELRVSLEKIRFFKTELDITEVSQPEKMKRAA